MPFCPTCKQEFTTEEPNCPNDGAVLVGELPYQTIDAPHSAWVEIASASTMDEAQIIQGFLEAEGFPCQIESLKFSMEPVNFGSMGEIRIYVSAENEAEAMQLVQERIRLYETLPEDESVVTDEGPAQIADDAETVTETEER